MLIIDRAIAACPGRLPHEFFEKCRGVTDTRRPVRRAEIRFAGLEYADEHWSVRTRNGAPARWKRGPDRGAGSPLRRSVGLSLRECTRDEFITASVGAIR